MRTVLVIMVITYVALTLGGASAALAFTIQIYTLHGRALPDILSAAILNTAAVFAATSFFGVLDMFLTLWTLLKSKDWEEEARKEREADRQARQKEWEANQQAREADREAREAERQAWQQSLQETRAFQQLILEQLAAERAQRDLMTSRVLDLLEQVSHRLNGNSGNGHQE